jgi:hypothetical protein
MITALWLLVALASPPYARPDPAQVPGVVRPLTQQAICATRWGMDHRVVRRAWKVEAGRRQGIPERDWPQYRLDHLVSRSMGGADDPRNVWWQPLKESRIKDRLEVFFDRAVCDGRVQLQTAQQALRDDWRAAFERYIGPLPEVPR